MRASQLEARYSRPHAYLGVAFYRLGNESEAITQLDRAIELDPRDSMPYMLKSALLTDRQEAAAAVEAARQALTLTPFLKSLNQIATTDKGSANVGNAFAYFGLEDWALHMAQSSNYPFWAGTQLFLSDRYTSRYSKRSGSTQGLLAGSNRLWREPLDPAAVTETGHPFVGGLLPRKSRQRRQNQRTRGLVKCLFRCTEADWFGT